MSKIKDKLIKQQEEKDFDIDQAYVALRAKLEAPFPITKEYFKVNFKTKLVEPLVPRIRERLDEVFGKGGWKLTSNPTNIKEKWNGQALETHVYAKLQVAGMPFKEYETFGVCDWMSANRLKIAESDALTRLSIHHLNLANLGKMYDNNEITPEILERNEARRNRRLVTFNKLEEEIINPQLIN